ncbi:unnamed protein product [Cuscuta campestris]|uniref:Uncharacterized protein n=1 Tax=Cuscuta campestris TaxID=132261 RepID=A0A484N291_9ASTE|nr:unnamed protein product [Cuscuta campestris]
MAEQERKPVPHHMFFPSSGFRNPLPFLGTYQSEPWEKIILRELKGCYVIVASFLAPILSASGGAESCHTLIRLFEEVSARRLNPECKIVIVTKVRPCATDIWSGRNVEKVIFNKFFSGFPKGVLAIPFSDYKSRDRVFSSLSKFKQPPDAVLVVDPVGKVLGDSFGFLCSYGAAFYPFSMDHRRELSRRDEFFMERLNPFTYQDSPSPSLNYKDTLLSLAELFDHSPEDVLLAKIRGATMADPSPLSTLLKGQIVALYLCANGHLMDSLVKIYLQCRGRVPKLEVVVVPLAFSDYPHSYYRQIVHALAEHNITTWWALHPYNDKIVRTLFRLSGGRNFDRLILLPAVGETDSDSYSYCGDINAHAVLSLLGLYPLANRALPPSMYPFTTEKLYLERLSSLRQVTLPSLLCRYKPDLSSEALQQLQGKNGHDLELGNTAPALQVDLDKTVHEVRREKDLNRLMDHLGFASAAGLKIIQSIQRVLDFPAAVAI